MRQKGGNSTATTKTPSLAEYLAAADIELSADEAQEILSMSLAYHFRAWASDRFDPTTNHEARAIGQEKRFWWTI